ncbi:murein transglycosylase A [Sinisalibacter aestuarii]|uniref:peptidoglycan lytic exotransglycosylase n=1 Tax=Sinisalibacter aestuarii TaxID=2949426 RepID=A0ABQ5LQ89_9RHOB|nr:murein transglycosylase A [Sinisalibacter aestuarii]GKY86441.1 murein transglycosylase [Sinisalibacter aestuarii]
MRGLVALVLAGLLAAASPAAAGLDEADVTILAFDELDGWEEDDHAAALEVFLETCRILDDAQWRPICNLAQAHSGPAKQFFELFFRPVLIEDSAVPLFTAYYEPEILGARRPTARFNIPVYRKPPELSSGALWFTREEIETGGILNGRGLEIAWVEDPVELQFLQIQGSGRIRLRDGSAIRLGYAGSNGHRYRSLGDELVRRGIYSPHQVSAPVIRAWVRRNPQEGADLLLHNPSYVFFREVGHVPADRGPLGAMNRSITAHRTLAVDPEYTPLGAPVWLEKDGAEPFNRLMIAQDTGSRIKGAQRADIFFGTGDEAGRLAGQIRDPGRMVTLLPIQQAYALKPEG